ncbi:MAG: hypothetical protein ACTSXQ_05005 [Alphaproteobacteria bacterium]
MKHILIPHEIVDKFSLYEALEWIVYKGIPTDYDLGYTDEDMFGMSRTVFAEREYGFPQEDCIIREDPEGNQADTEIGYAEIFLALKKGVLPAYGVLNGKVTIEERLKKPVTRYRTVQDDVEEFISEHSELISPDSWRFEKIDWLDCILRTDTVHYYNIWVNRDDLFKCFPPSEPQYIKVKTRAGFIVLDEENFTPQASKNTKEKRGRPPKVDWSAFHIEMARRIKDELLPKKQESCIADMQEWCKKHYGSEPARTTVLQKVSPYYQEFVRK